MTKEELLKTAKPILFNADMVRAILDGRKTVTRRVVKPRYREGDGGFQVCWSKENPNAKWVEKMDEDEGSYDPPRYVMPPYQPGDYLYVRESFCPNYFDASVRKNKFAYKADYYREKFGDTIPEPKWRPSIHMPKEAARIFLKITDVRIERLNVISQDQIIQEGIQAEYLLSAYHELWDSTVKPKDRDEYGWDANPWCWVIEFERVGAEE